MTEMRSIEDIPLNVMFVSPKVKIGELEKGLNILRGFKIKLLEGSIRSKLNVEFKGEGIITIYPDANIKIDYEGIKGLQECEVSYNEDCVIIKKDFLDDKFIYNFYKKGY